MVYMLRIVIFCILVDMAISAIFNGSFLDNLEKKVNVVKPLETRRKTKSQRSTSSSSREKKEAGAVGSTESLGLSFSQSSSDPKELGKKQKSYKPKSSKERRRWYKWHRKCTPCPDDMRLKWRDPGIKWICGGYQRARRSFKSLCMMHYRNCQDGTMFTKISDYRCQNASEVSRHGDHFFYDYKAVLSLETIEESSSDSSSSGESKTGADTGSWSSNDVQNAINALN